MTIYFYYNPTLARIKSVKIDLRLHLRTDLVPKVLHVRVEMERKYTTEIFDDNHTASLVTADADYWSLGAIIYHWRSSMEPPRESPPMTTSEMDLSPLMR